MTDDAGSPAEYFQLTRHGDVAVIIPSPEVENLPETLIRSAADLVLAPLKADPPTHLIVDLSGVPYFGSAFISFLLRCHLLARSQGSELILSGASEKSRELLRLTQLDTVWAIYDSREEAIETLVAYD